MIYLIHSSEYLEITNYQNRKIDSDFLLFKDKVLGKDYLLNIHFVSEYKMKNINNEYRKINKNTDILSFPMDDKQGEIFFNIKKIEIKAKKFNMKFKDYFNYLIIHGMLHLKGMDHGDMMDIYESKFCKYFDLKYPYEKKI